MKRSRRGLLVFVLFLVALIAALLTGEGLFFSLAYLFAAVLVASFLWAWINIHGLRVTRQTRAARSQVGEIAEERFVVENTGLLPKLWLELMDKSELPAHRASHVISGLGYKQTQYRIVRTMSLRRGRFRLGPITLRSSDPFGLFSLQRDLELTTSLVVYPRTIELPFFHPMLGEMTGGESANRRTHYVTTNVSGVRDYAPGDSFNRIHWPTTARTNRLIVKEFELDPVADVWIILDMERSVHVGPAFHELPIPVVPEVPWESWQLPDIDPSTEEYAIVTAASLVQHFLRQDRAVGMVTYSRGTHCELVQSDRGERQEDRLLEILAATHPHGTIALEQVLIAEGARFNRNATLIIVTPSVRSAWAAAVRHIVSRGIQISCVVIEPGSFGAPYHGEDVVAELSAGHVPSYMVRRGDKIDEILANIRR